MRLARTLSSVAAAALSTAACGGTLLTRRPSPSDAPIRKAERRGRSKSTTTAADSFPAEIGGSQIVWHDTLHYYLDRASGALTFRNASSTGRLCYPPYMPCRLTACSKSLHGQRFATPIGGTKRRRGQSRGGGGRLVVQIPGLNCLKFRQCGAKEIRSYPLLGAKSRWFAMLAGRNAPGALADKWNHLIDKESAQNQCVGTCPDRKRRATFSSFVLLAHLLLKRLIGSI